MRKQKKRKKIVHNKNKNKNISLAERMLQKTLKKSAHNIKHSELKALFLVQKSEIQEAMLKFSTKGIWEFMHSEGEFPGSYPTFLRMVKKYIEEPQKAQDEERKPPPIEKKKFEPQPIRHFIHNPNPDPNDLW